MSRLLERLRAGKIVLMDGAMGSELARRGARLGSDCLELWNLTRGHDVRSVHRAYLEAGAECLLTNTFQANPTALGRHRLQHRLTEIWRAALSLARDHPGHEPLVLADVGPLTRIDELDPVISACSGADGILLETWSDVDQLHPHTGLERLGLPLFVSFTFRRNARGRLETFRAYDPETCARAAAACGAAAIGVNCGRDIAIDDMAEVLTAYRSVSDLPFFARPNAGTPDEAGRYPRSPAALAAALPRLLEAGVRMVGGCCGTTPEHIAAFQEICAAWKVEAPSGWPYLPA